MADFMHLTIKLLITQVTIISGYSPPIPWDKSQNKIRYFSENYDLKRQMLIWAFEYHMVSYFGGCKNLWFSGYTKNGSISYFDGCLIVYKVTKRKVNISWNLFLRIFDRQLKYAKICTLQKLPVTRYFLFVPVLLHWLNVETFSVLFECF